MLIRKKDKFASYTGQLLRIDLSTRNVRKEKLDPGVARRYLGSKGLGAYILFKELTANVDALGPENKLIFMTGPLTATAAPGSSRFSISSRSPLTGTYTDSHCGSLFGVELKFAGYDGMIIEGQASHPVYINIFDGRIDILDADFLWGIDTFSTEKKLKANHHQDRPSQTVCIGPAGERKALLSSIISEGRAAGRGGLGAGMGSKNLKAVCVVG